MTATCCLPGCTPRFREAALEAPRLEGEAANDLKRFEAVRSALESHACASSGSDCKFTRLLITYGDFARKRAKCLERCIEGYAALKCTPSAVQTNSLINLICFRARVVGARRVQHGHLLGGSPGGGRPTRPLLLHFTPCTSRLE